MEKAQVGDSTTLAYERTGDGEPVLLIHGVLIADSFRPLFEQPELTGSYELIAYHRCGYGESTEPEGSVSIARQAEDAVKLLQHLGIERAHIIGHSLGGVIAIQFVLAYPEMTKSLTLLEPALIVGDSGKSYRESLSQGLSAMQNSDVETIVNEFFQVRFGDNYREGLDLSLPGAFQQAVSDASACFNSDIQGLLEWNFERSNAREIDVSTLVVLGEESREMSSRFEETYRILLDWLPNAEGVTIPDTAHGMQMQNPEGVASVLNQFLSQHPVDTAG